MISFRIVLCASLNGERSRAHYHIPVSSKKQQIYQRAAGLEKEGLFAAIPAVLAFPAELEPQGQNQQDDTDAVSYTHLDVYKRQG